MFTTELLKKQNFDLTEIQVILKEYFRINNLQEDKIYNALNIMMNNGPMVQNHLISALEQNIVNEIIPFLKNHYGYFEITKNQNLVFSSFSK